MDITFTHEALRAIRVGEKLLERQGGAEFDVEHLFYGVMKVLGRRAVDHVDVEAVDLDGLFTDLARLSDHGGAPYEYKPGSGRLKDTPRCETIFSRARSLALTHDKEDVVRINHLLKAIVNCADGDAATLVARYLKRPPQPGDSRPDLDRDVFERLRQSTPGQKAAVTRFFEAFEECWTRPVSEDQPIGVFWFIGPPGSGKTALATALQSEVFRDVRGLVRFDLSQIRVREDIERICGFNSSPSARPGAALTDAMREHPDCVVLLQNVERAHPGAHELLLRMFNEGRLTDGGGEYVDFSRAVIIMTSDAYSGLAFGDQGATNGSLPLTDSQIGVPPNFERVSRFQFITEFRQRIDAEVPFQPVARDQRLVQLKQAVTESFPDLKSRGISFVMAHGAREWLFKRVSRGGGSVRQLKRLIEAQFTSQIYEGPGRLKVPDDSAIFVEVEGHGIALHIESSDLLAGALEDAIYGMPFGLLLDDREIVLDITPEGAAWLAERIHEMHQQAEFAEIPVDDEFLPLRRVFGDSKLHAAQVVLNRFVSSPMMGWFLKGLIPDQASVRFHPIDGELTMAVSDGPIIMKLTDSGLMEWWLRRDLPMTKGIPVRRLVAENRIPRNLVADMDDHVPEDLWEYVEKWLPFLPEDTVRWCLARSSELGLVWPWRIGWYWQTFPADSDHDDDDEDDESEEFLQRPRPPRKDDDTFNNYYLIDPPDEDDEDEDDDA